ncbi:MAG: hypothetical protein AAFP98_08620 [Pseudomonadota bacterium]
MLAGGTLLGFLVSVFALILANTFFALKERRMKATRSVEGTDPLLIKVASIAKDLSPLIDKLHIGRGQIVIVGGDGSYLMNDRTARYFKRSLSRWLKQGLDICYILTCADRATELRFADLCSDKDFPGLKVYSVKETRSSLEAVFCKRYRNFHPTLIETEDHRRAIWLEGDHPDNSEFAYNIKFVSPTAMSAVYEKEFEEIKGQIVDIMLNSSLLKASPIANEQQAA